MTLLRIMIAFSVLLFGTSTTFANEENTGTGTVSETMTSGGYVYVHLVEEDTWVASFPVPVEVGDKIKYSGGMTMKDFTSRTLNRTFDYILFAGKIEVINQINADMHASVKTNDSHVVEESITAEAPKPGEITPLNDGKTVADIHTGLGQLKDQQVSLRGRVMKVSENIVGKNWITLQDGTGTAPADKLIVTSTELVGVGDLVTVTGVVHTNVDLGSGYSYPVLIEEATFSQ